MTSSIFSFILWTGLATEDGTLGLEESSVKLVFFAASLSDDRLRMGLLPSLISLSSDSLGEAYSCPCPRL